VPNVQTDDAQVRLCDSYCCSSVNCYAVSGALGIDKRIAAKFSSWGAVETRFE
jgi:hypothetical protein